MYVLRNNKLIIQRRFRNIILINTIHFRNNMIESCVVLIYIDNKSAVI